MNKQEEHRKAPEKYKRNGQADMKYVRSLQLPLPVSQRKCPMGKFYATSLFLEKNTSSSVWPPFSLENEDRWIEGEIMYAEGAAPSQPVRHYPSMKRIYMEYYYDPTEYEFVQAVFGDWEHWERLCETKWFAPIVNAWRKEAEIKLRSKAIKELADIAVSEGAKGLNAAKWLAEGKWKSTGAGRPVNNDKPTKQEIEKEIEDDVAEDLKRLRLVIGGAN